MTDNFEKDIDVPSKRKKQPKPVYCLCGHYLDLSQIWHFYYDKDKGVQLNEGIFIDCGFGQYMDLKLQWFKHRGNIYDR